MDKRYSHRLSTHPLYDIWQHMIQRCYNPNNRYYHNYGGRSGNPIFVCEEWRSPNIKQGHPQNGNPGFIAFYKWSILNNWKPGLSLDRIDNDGPYAPWNCRWTTMQIQQNNKRTNTKIIDYDGSVYTISQLAHKYNVPANWIFHKIARGWEIDAILYALHNQNLGIHKHTVSKNYIDKYGYIVLIPRRNLS